MCYRRRLRPEHLMRRQLSMTTRRELLRALRERYSSGTREDKQRILDEFVSMAGCHRKHAIRMLNKTAAPELSPRAKVYDDAVRETLIVLWEASDRICGKRLKPLIPILISALERHGHLKLDEKLRGLLSTISAATIDRVLAPTRKTAAGVRRKRASSPL